MVIRRTSGYSAHHSLDPYFIGYAAVTLNERGNHDPAVVLGSRHPDVFKGSFVATCSLKTCLNLSFEYSLRCTLCSYLLVSAKCHSCRVMVGPSVSSCISGRRRLMHTLTLSYVEDRAIGITQKQR